LYKHCRFKDFSSVNNAHNKFVDNKPKIKILKPTTNEMMYPFSPIRIKITKKRPLIELVKGNTVK
jgi:hypothetical protein